MNVFNVINPFVVTSKVSSVFVSVISNRSSAIDAGLVLFDESDSMITNKSLNHVKFVIVFVMVLFAFLSFKEVEIVLRAVASFGNSLLELLNAQLSVMEEDSFL